MWMPWAIVSYRMSPVRVFWCLSLICTEGCALLICHIRVPVSPWLLVANIDPHLLAGVLIRLLHGEAPSPSTVLSGGVSLHTHILPGPVFLLWPPALPICLQKAGPPLRVSGASITLTSLRQYPSQTCSDVAPEGFQPRYLATSTCTQTPSCPACWGLWPCHL